MFAGSALLWALACSGGSSDNGTGSGDGGGDATQDGGMSGGDGSGGADAGKDTGGGSQDAPGDSTQGTDGGFPAGWLYTKGSTIYVSNGGSGTPWMGRGVNVDDIFLCGYDNTLWMQ